MFSFGISNTCQWYDDCVTISTTGELKTVFKYELRILNNGAVITETYTEILKYSRNVIKFLLKQVQTLLNYFWNIENLGTHNGQVVQAMTRICIP
jgi:hypothetical protein